MVRSLAATRVDLSSTANNRAGAIQLAAREYERNVPVLREMAREIENRQAISSGQPSSPQPTAFDGMYRDSMGTVWGADGYEASSTLSQAYSDIEDASNGSTLGARSLVTDAATTAVIAVVSAPLSAAYGLVTAGTAMFGSTDPLDRLQKLVQGRLDQYEEIRRAASGQGVNYGGTMDGNAETPRPEDPYAGEYRMAGTAPKTPQPAMAVAAPAPMI